MTLSRVARRFDDGNDDDEDDNDDDMRYLFANNLPIVIVVECFPYLSQPVECIFADSCYINLHTTMLMFGIFSLRIYFASISAIFAANGFIFFGCTFKLMYDGREMSKLSWNATHGGHGIEWIDWQGSGPAGGELGEKEINEIIAMNEQPIFCTISITITITIVIKILMWRLNVVSILRQPGNLYRAIHNFHSLTIFNS